MSQAKAETDNAVYVLGTMREMACKCGDFFTLERTPSYVSDVGILLHEPWP